jgi:hypothetical protein
MTIAAILRMIYISPLSRAYIVALNLTAEVNDGGRAAREELGSPEKAGETVCGEHESPPVAEEIQAQYRKSLLSYTRGPLSSQGSSGQGTGQSHQPIWPSRSNEQIFYGKKESPLAPKEHQMPSHVKKQGFYRKAPTQSPSGGVVHAPAPHSIACLRVCAFLPVAGLRACRCQGCRMPDRPAAEPPENARLVNI